jgi:hypothetical protein
VNRRFTKKATMKKLLFITLLMSIYASVYTQEIKKPAAMQRNSIYFEAFSQGLYNSLSYDRLFSLDKKVKTSFSAGITLIPHPDLFVVGTPVSFNFIFFQKSHHLELGLGFTPLFIRFGNIYANEWYLDESGTLQENYFTGHSNDIYNYFTPKIGYRYQKPEGGLFLRATFTPPLAGINLFGDTKGGMTNTSNNYRTEYFQNAAFYSGKVFPWAGISIGWTLKSK